MEKIKNESLEKKSLDRTIFSSKIKSPLKILAINYIAGAAAASLGKWAGGNLEVVCPAVFPGLALMKKKSTKSLILPAIAYGLGIATAYSDKIAETAINYFS